MATITIQVVEAGQSNATKTYTLPDSQIDRLVSAYQVAANASINATANRAQVLNYWANQWMASTVSYVQSIEGQTASASALAAVTPIAPV